MNISQNFPTYSWNSDSSVLRCMGAHHFHREEQLLSELEIRGDTDDNSKIIFLFLNKNML